MKRTLPFLAGLIACVLGLLAFAGIAHLNRPYGSIANDGFSTIVVSSDVSPEKVTLDKGESRNFSYGMYEIFIPELDQKISLFKNNDGSCTLTQSDGILVVQTEGVASLGGP